MASHHRGALALLLLVSLSAVAQACYFAREAHLHKDVMRRGRGRGRGREGRMAPPGDVPVYRRALQQASLTTTAPRGSPTCTPNAFGPANPSMPAQGTADAKIRELAWQVIMKGGANSVGLLKPNCTLANVNPTNTATAWNCVNWQTLGQRLVAEPIPPAATDPLAITQSFSLGTFVRLAFHDCGAMRRTGNNTYEGGCDDSFMWEAQYGPVLNGASLATNAGAAIPRISYPGNGIPAPDTRTGPARDYPNIASLGIPTCLPDPDRPTFCTREPPVTGAIVPYQLVNPNGDPSMSMAHWRMQQWKVDIDTLIAREAAFSNRVTKPRISKADLIQLSGAAVIALSGGSTKAELYDLIPMGRQDTTNPAPIPALMQLPAATDTITQQLCNFLANGYTDREMAALVATHTLGNNDIGPMSVNWNNYDNDYLTMLKQGGQSLAAGTGPQVNAGFVRTPLNPAGFDLFVPAFISDVELYTMATGVGPAAIGVGAPGANPVDPPAARTGLVNLVPGTNTPLAPGQTAISPTRSLIEEWLNGATGWTKHLADLSAAYQKMGRMGNTRFVSHGAVAPVGGR